MNAASGVIFDFDGVIADSEAQHCRAFQRAFAERGRQFTAADYYDRYLGYSDREVFDVAARERREALPAAEHERLVAFKGRVYADLLDSGAVLCPGAVPRGRTPARHRARPDTAAGRASRSTAERGQQSD